MTSQYREFSNIRGGKTSYNGRDGKIHFYSHEHYSPAQNKESKKINHIPEKMYIVSANETGFLPRASKKTSEINKHVSQ